jgi:hypothetical protein
MTNDKSYIGEELVKNLAQSDGMPVGGSQNMVMTGFGNHFRATNDYFSTLFLAPSK